MGDFQGPTAFLEKSRGISPVLGAWLLSDALITQILADEELLCGNAAVYAVIIIMIIMIIIHYYQETLRLCLYFKCIFNEYKLQVNDIILRMNA